MDKFWKWMESKEYGFKNSNSNHVVWIKNQDSHNQNAGFPTKQMLIGYKIDYLIEEGADIEDICLYMESIDTLDNYLDEKIKE